MGAALLALNARVHALDMQFSFVNSDGIGTTLGDVVTGTIYDLQDGNNFGPLKVTLDSIVPVDDFGWTPHTWTDVFPSFLTLSGGTVTSINLAAIDGSIALFLQDGGASFASNVDFDKFYSNGEGKITFTPVNTPDGGATVSLLGCALAGLGFARRRLS